mmetsp:Transcript_32964/g.99305  ORF Transcript_32964/g.99305 Transcript_32964/m.99305 type:complete len:105 (-) Transcript_32964:87-401(-)
MPPAQGATRPVANWLERIRERLDALSFRAAVQVGGFAGARGERAGKPAAHRIRATLRLPLSPQIWRHAASNDTPQANKQTKRHLAHLPNELFPRIARYYWGGET